MSRTKLLASYSFVMCGILDMHYEAKLHGPEFGRGTVYLSVYRKGTLLKKWELPSGNETKNLRHAMRTAALTYYWQHPGKTLSAARPEYEAFSALCSLYDNMTDDVLTQWMAESSYEFEFDAEANISTDVDGPIPVVATATCDGQWFRITLRIPIHNGEKNQRDDLVLTRDYSSAVTTTLPELLNRIGQDSAKLIIAAGTAAGEKKSSTPDYPNLTKEFFSGYRTRE